MGYYYCVTEFTNDRECVRRQQGQRGNRRARAAASRLRIEAIECTMCRSGQSGTARPQARGKRRRVVRPCKTLLRGKTAPLGNEEAVGCDRQASMMMKASPAPALVVPETDFLLEPLVVALDPPACLG